MTLELDRGRRTPPHGDALLEEPRLELVVHTVPLDPALARACELASDAWARMLGELPGDTRLLLETHAALDERKVLGLEPPSRIVIGVDHAPLVAPDDLTVWGIPVRVDPTLEPGQWRLEVGR